MGFISILQFEQPVISRPPTHLNLNVVRITKSAQINGPFLIWPFPFWYFHLLYQCMLGKFSLENASNLKDALQKILIVLKILHQLLAIIFLSKLCYLHWPITTIDKYQITSGRTNLSQKMTAISFLLSAAVQLSQ